MFDWFLRAVTVVAAFWVSHVYIVATSGDSLSPVNFETLKYSVLGVWRAIHQEVGRFDWLILSPLAVGFILVAALAYGLLRPVRS